jgi:DNA-binding PadR family transcriptional regulator
MILGTIHAGLAMVKILRATQQGPRTTRELVQTLQTSGLPLEARTLHPLLRRLVQEGYLASALHLEPGCAGVRRYWTTRRGTLASDHLQRVIAEVAGPSAGRH